MSDKLIKIALKSILADEFAMDILENTYLLFLSVAGARSYLNN